MQKAYKYRLYPSRAQARVIDETTEMCRLLYNELLALKKEAYNKGEMSPSRKDLYKQVKRGLGKEKRAFPDSRSMGHIKALPCHK